MCQVIVFQTSMRFYTVLTPAVKVSESGSCFCPWSVPVELDVSLESPLANMNLRRLSPDDFLVLNI